MPYILHRTPQTSETSTHHHIYHLFFIVAKSEDTREHVRPTPHTPMRVSVRCDLPLSVIPPFLPLIPQASLVPALPYIPFNPRYAAAQWPSKKDEDRVHVSGPIPGGQQIPKIPELLLHFVSFYRTSTVI